MTTREEVVAEARSWLGTPYVHQHRAKGHAVDCLGLVIGVARSLGLLPSDFDVNGYARTPDGKTLLAECDRYMTRVPATKMEPGHVVVIRWHRDPQHMGVLGNYLHGGLSMIHALGTTDGKGSVVEHGLTPRFVSRIVRVYALPGVA